MHILVLDRTGRHAGVTTQEGATYVVRDGSMQGATVLPRSVLASE
jgi:hypothetical protein